MSIPTEAAIVAAGGESEEPTPPLQAQTPVEIYGDAAYGAAELVEKIERAGAEANVKVQAPAAVADKFAKDAFEVDLTNIPFAVQPAFSS